MDCQKTRGLVLRVPGEAAYGEKGIGAAASTGTNPLQDCRVWGAESLPLGAVLGIVKIVDVTYAEELLDEIDYFEERLGFWEE